MTLKPSDLPLRCRCGHVRGVAHEVSPSAGFRLTCYCKDCQAFAHFLERPDVMDDAGGTGIFQLPPRRLKFAAGANMLACLRLSAGTPVLRWYATCCRTPIANTAGACLAMVGLIHSFIDEPTAGPSRDDILGPRLCRIHERSATAPLPADAPPRPSLAVFAKRSAKLFNWWWRGLAKPNPFFDAHSGAPRATPRMPTASERVEL